MKRFVSILFAAVMLLGCVMFLLLSVDIAKAMESAVYTTEWFGATASKASLLLSMMMLVMSFIALVITCVTFPKKRVA